MKWNVLETTGLEIASKYLYLGIIKLLEKEQQFDKDIDYLEITNEALSCALGITLARLYRARLDLVNLNLIEHSKRFNPYTGKKLQIFIELLLTNLYKNSLEIFMQID